VFRCPTLCKKVTLGAEVGEEVALGVLAAQILALSRCVGVSVVVKDVVLREIASTFKEIATHTLCNRRRRGKSQEEKKRK